MSSNPNIQKFREELRTFAKANRVGLLGILNTTPDSFFDGGKNLLKKAAITNGLKMLDAGIYRLIHKFTNDEKTGSLLFSSFIWKP